MPSLIIPHALLSLAFVLILVRISHTTPEDVIKIGHPSVNNDRLTQPPDFLTLKDDLLCDAPLNDERVNGQIYDSDDKLDPATPPQTFRRGAHNDTSCGIQHTSLSNRGLVSDLGFTLLWGTMDIIIGSSLAYYQSTEFYANISRNAGGKWRSRPTVHRLVITYGIFQLTFTSAGHILWHCIKDLAMVLSLIVAGITFGTFRLVALATWATIIITLALVWDNNRPMHLISAPFN